MHEGYPRDLRDTGIHIHRDRQIKDPTLRTGRDHFLAYRRLDGASGDYEDFRLLEGLL